jgi:hypothetical protein
MRRKIKSYVLNMHVVGAFSVLVICVSLISCDYWFGKDDDYDVQTGVAYAGHPDARWESALTPLAPTRKLLFTSRPIEERVIKNLVEIGTLPSKGNNQFDP